MIQLPPPAVGYTANGSTGEAAQGLLSGGMAVMRTPRTKRAYVLNWQRLAGRDWQIVEGFYRRLFGAGPWCFAAPDDRNRLPTTAALGGGAERRHFEVRHHGRDAHLRLCHRRAADRALGCREVGRRGRVVAARHRAGCRGLADPDIATTTSTGTSAPYLPGEPVTVSMYARTLTSTASVNVSRDRAAANGTVTLKRPDVTNVTLTTSWQRLTVTATAGTLGTARTCCPS
jgi:hypothetical protein